MVINLATIDFCPGQGGGEAVIRSLDVTENGTYTAPSGVDGYNPVRVAVSGGGGSITPEEQAALDTLVNASEGVLYTNEFEAEKAYFDKYGVNNASPDCGNNMYNINGDVYLYWYQWLYKFDEDSCLFKSIRFFNNNYWSPIWKDNSGRFYQGVYVELDFETGNMDLINFGDNIGNYYLSTNGSRHNIIPGEFGIYLLNSSASFKFNETTQKFDSFTVTFPQDFNSDAYICYWFKWNGHCLFIDGDYNKMYEFIESENSGEVIEVSSPYFPMTTADSISVSFNISYAKYIFPVGDELYFMYTNNHFRLVDGQWVRFEVYNSNYGTVYFGSYNGVSTDKLIICGNAYNEIGITNPSTSNCYGTGWSPVSSVAVDLKNDQYIRGYKRFDSIDTGSINVTNVVGTNVNMNLNGKTAFNSGSVDFVTSGLFTKNGVDIATIDKCILNSTYESTGLYFSPVVNVATEFYQYFFTVGSGRVFYVSNGNYFEFDGTQWNSVQFTYNISPESVKNAIGNTFAMNGNNVYIWDDANSDWVEIVTNGDYTFDYYYIWVCGDTLRYGDSMKLVNNGGTWSWEIDQTTFDYPANRYYVFNNTVYVFANNGYVKTYDESTKTYTQLNQYYIGSEVYFEFAGDIYYTNYNNTIYKLDLTQVQGGIDDFNVKVNIFNAGMNYVYVEYNNKLYTVDTNNMFGYVYNVTYTVPAVPASNGTYVLQATRVGDQITYEWVPNVI